MGERQTRSSLPWWGRGGARFSTRTGPTSPRECGLFSPPCSQVCCPPDSSPWSPGRAEWLSQEISADLLSEGCCLHLSGSLGPEAAGRGQLPLGRLPGRWAAVCACFTNICSEHLSVFFLSPLHPPLSVCQNTNGPLLGPCHLVSIRVTPVTPSLLDLCA